MTVSNILCNCIERIMSNNHDCSGFIGGHKHWHVLNFCHLWGSNFSSLLCLSGEHDSSIGYQFINFSKKILMRPNTPFIAKLVLKCSVT